MLRRPRPCEWDLCLQATHVRPAVTSDPGLTLGRFVNSEKWRKEFGGQGIGHLVRTFDYKEKPDVIKYYPQYYHKTDKVGFFEPKRVRMF
jgi:hypothetical protein